MTFVLAIEGLDGAGKNTAANAVKAYLEDRNIRVTVISFPRYDTTVGGWALGEFLSGRLKREVSPAAAAVLYALDRFESVREIKACMTRCDVLVFDRYIGSNVAYQAAKVGPPRRKDLMKWIANLELKVFGVPAPSLSVFLDTPRDLSKQMILQKRPRDYTDLELDKHESDDNLQLNVRAAYQYLVTSKVMGAWAVVETVEANSMKSPAAIAEEIAVCMRQAGFDAVKRWSTA